MKAFVLAVLAAILVAAVAAWVLETQQRTVAEAFARRDELEGEARPPEN